MYPKYKEVHVLILTWKFHDLRTAPYTAPPSADYVSLEDETRRLHETFGSFGYNVQDWSIPMERPLEKMRNRIKKFCRLAADDTLLIVYYHGHGSLDDDNELVFSRYVSTMIPYKEPTILTASQSRAPSQPRLVPGRGGRTLRRYAQR